MNFKLLMVIVLFASYSYGFEEITDIEMSNVSGQNGVSISGNLNFNETGGPLTAADSSNVWGTCAEKASATVQRCGTRLSAKLNDDTGLDGWIALDELTGELSFEGLTLRSREIDATADAANFGGDAADSGIDGMTVLEIGLPNQVKFKDFKYSIVTSSEGRPTDIGYTQQTRIGIDFNGKVNMQGNLLVFPTGNP